jgi:hypothetical protein
MSKNKQNTKRKLRNPNRKNTKLISDFNFSRKEGIKLLGERYVDWYYKKFADLKKFWLHEFLYPIVFPVLSMGILRYALHFSFSREQGIILFMLFYSTTILGRILSKYNKLVQVLDPLIDEVMEMKKNAEEKKKKKI